MPERIESPPRGQPSSLAILLAQLSAHYARRTCFREDAALAEALAREAEPVIEALCTAFAPGDGPRAVHEAYALSTLLARTAALLGATPCALLALTEALCETLTEAGVPVDGPLARALSLVMLEGYCAARDEGASATLRRAAAESQHAIKLAPHCTAIVLSGRHEEGDLTPVLESLARGLLRDDIHSCLLDLSRLDAEQEEIARVVAQLCESAASLGVRLFVVGASARLRARLAVWLGLGDRLQHHDDYAAAQLHALAAVGLELRPRTRWPLRFWQTRQALSR